MFNAGFFFWMSYIMLPFLRLAIGITQFENKKDEQLIIMTKIVSGKSILIREIPDAFKAASSQFSPSFPNTITDESNMAIGSATGTKRADA